MHTVHLPKHTTLFSVLRKPTIFVKALCLLLLVGFLGIEGAKGQTTVFSDAFTTSRGTTYTAANGAIGSSTIWSMARAGNDWGSRIDGGILDLTNDASATTNVAGWVYGNTPLSNFSSPFTTTLSSNPGVVTWTFNMRTNRTSALAGFSATTSYGLAMVLASTSNTPNTTGSGYAVVMGGGSNNNISLIYFTGGLQGTRTSVIAFGGVTPSALTNYLSVNVTYTPSTNSWSLSDRDDGTSAADPATGSFTSVGSGTNSTGTGTAMTYFGGYWQGSTGATQTGFIDNVKVDLSPNAPTNTTITPGNGQLSVAFTAPTLNGGSAITNYKYSTDGGSNFTAVSPAQTTSPIVITGLTNGTSYNVQIRAVNANGDGIATSSTAATPRTVPGAPTIGTATVAGVSGTASVPFTAPASNGGSVITSYTVTSSPGGLTGTGSSSPISVTGLTNGTAYTFTVTATNAAGVGSASSASNSVTPYTVPGAPTIGTASVSGLSGTAIVPFTAPASNGGNAITSYTVTSSPGGLTGTGSSSPISVTGLTNGTAYTFTVTATNAAGAGAASSASNSVTPYTVPGAPTIGTAVPGNSSAAVTFTAPSSNGGSAITGYTVTSSPGGFTGTGTSSPITVNGLSNGTAYTFTVTASNLAGAGSASAASNSVTPTSGATVPDPPTIGTATAGNASASVAFTAPASDGGAAITGYTVTSSPGGFTGTGSGSPISVNGLTNGTAYTFTVYATNSVGNSLPSAASNSVTPATVPSAPTITAITAGNGQLSVAFTAGASNGSVITNYKYSIDGGSSFTAVSPVQTTSPIVITGLTNGTTYNVQILAVNAVGDGAASGTSTATPVTTPSAPTITGITPGNTQLSVAFTAPSSTGGSAITNYKYSTNGGSTFTAVSPAQTTSPIVITGLTNGTSYNVQIRAVNAVGDGTATASTAATPATTPSAPTITSITPGNGQLTINFTAGATGGSAITNYKYSTDGGSTFTAISPAQTTTTPIVITGLTNNTTYQVQLRAINAIGDGTATSSTGGTPSLYCASTTRSTTPSAYITNFTTTGATSNLNNNSTFTLSGSGSFINQIVSQNQGGSVNYSATISGVSGGVSFAIFVDWNQNGVFTDAGETVVSLGSGTQITTNPSGSFSVPAGATVGNTQMRVVVNYATGAVVSCNSLINGDTEDYTFAVLSPSVPSAPTITGITATASGTLSVAFTAGAANGSSITNYKYSIDNGASFTATSPAQTTSPIAITGLTPGTTYQIQIRAVNSVGDGTATASTAATAATTPSAPTITGITAGNAQLSVAFTAPSSDGFSTITNYQYSTNGGSTFTSAGTTSSPIVITGLTNNTTYQVQLRAVNAAGNGTATVSTDGTPVAQVPSAPTGVTITSGDRQLSVAFTAGSNGGSTITNYKYSIDGGSTFTAVSPAQATSPIVITGLTNGTTYQVQIRAVNAVGDGVATASVAGTPALTPVALASWNFGTTVSNSNSNVTTNNLTISSISVGNNNGTSTLLANGSASDNSGSSGQFNAGAATINGSFSSGSSTYFQFVLTPDAGYAVSISSLSFNTRSTGTGPTNYALRSSIDNYATDLATGSISTNSTWSAKSNSALSIVGSSGTAVTFRLYGFGGSSASTNTVVWRIDDVVFTGNMIQVVASTLDNSGLSQLTSQNIARSTTNNVVSRNVLTVTNGTTSLTGLSFTTPTTSNYTQNDISNFKLYYTTGNTFTTSNLLGTVVSTKNGTGITETINFSGLSQSLTAGIYYLWITADVKPTATATNTLIIGAPIVTTSTGTITNSGSASGAHIISAGTPTPYYLKDNTAFSSLNFFTLPNGGGTTLSANGLQLTSSDLSLIVDVTGVNLSAELTLGNNSSITVGQSSSGSLNLASGFAVTGTVNVGAYGNLILTASSIPTLGTLATGSTVTYNQSGSQAVTSTTYDNLSFSGTGTRSLTAGVTVTGTLTVPSGITFNTGSNTVTGKVDIQSGATFITANAGGINGAVSNAAGSTFSTTANYEFNGTSSQILGAALPSTVNNLTISNGNPALALNGSTTVNGALALSGGTKLVIGGSNTLTLNGTFSGNASSNLVGSSSSNITIGGSGAVGTLRFDQTTNGTTNVLNNLVVNNSYTSGAAVSLGDSLKLVGTLTPSAGQLATGGYLTLLSTNEYNSAAIGAATGNTFTTNYITGNVTTQRYSQAQRGYRTLAHPFKTAQTLSQLTDNIRITGLTTGASGTYATSSGNPSVFTYNPLAAAGSLATLTRLTNGSSAVWPVGNALYLFVRGAGNQGANGAGASNYTGGNALTAVTMDALGDVNQGDVTVNLGYGDVTTDNFNLVGNPYPSAINLKNVTGLANGTIYVYNPIKNNGTSDQYNVRGGFDSYTYTNGSTDIIVPAMGGFYVKATGSGQSLTFKETDKVSAAAPTYTVFGSAKQPAFSLKVTTASGDMDNVKFGFSSDATAASGDLYDAAKLSNSLFDIYSIASDSKKLTIDYRNTNALNSIIPLGIATSVANNFTISLNTLTDLPNTQLVLRDKFLKTETILSQVGDSYSFSITADTATKGDNRFEIGLLGTTVLPTQIADITAQLQANKVVAVSWTSTTEVNLAKYNVQRSKDGSNFSTIGTVAAKGASAYNYNDDLSTAGVLPATIYYRLEAVDKDGSKTYSKVVAVALGSNLAKAAINIYPNPVQTTLYAQVTVTKAGAAQLRVVDAQGKVVATQKTQLSVGTTSVSIPAAQLTAGNYVLEIDSADGKQTQRFVKE